MANQSAIVAMGICEAEEFAHVRFWGTISEAHSGPKTDVAQRAKVGYFPRCTRATHVVIPQVSSLGEFRWLKSHRLALWKAHVLRAPERLVTRQNARDFGQLSKTWDCEAQS